jgi:hypothetical protein
MAISRAQLLKELLPGLDKLFNDEYAQHKFPDTYHITKTRHKYQVWLHEFKGLRLVAKNIQHRREALAIIKLLKATKEN